MDNESTEPLEHTFTPRMYVSRREDGRYEVSFDFSDSYLGTMPEGWLDFDESGGGEGPAACAAVDAWVKTLPKAYIIDPADPEEGDRA